MLRDYQEEVLSQTRRALINCRGVCDVLPCRSGKSYIMAEMTNLAVAKGKKVLILAHRRILLDQHSKLIHNARIESVFTEVNHLGENGNPDLIIIDEAHISGCDSYAKVCDFYKDAKIVGFTATPARLDGKPLSLFQKLVIGLSHKELEARGDIAPYDLYSHKLDIDLSKVAQAGGDFVQSQLEPVMCDRKVYGDIVKEYLAHASGKQAIAYCSGIDHAMQIASLFNSRGIASREMDASTPEKEREETMADFKAGKFKILTNCNLISEGITVPECDCVMLLRPTQSLTLYIQQSCRCLTPRPNKRAVIIDFVGNCFTHGMPSDDHDWSLTDEIKPLNRSREPDVLVRICGHCFRAYPSKVGPICPYCGEDNGKTRKEIEDDKQAELERITEINKRNAKMEQGRARSLEQLIKVGKERGYKNPWAWANFVLRGREH
jgi:superfamily II DNA or RNA helicase